MKLPISLTGLAVFFGVIVPAFGPALAFGDSDEGKKIAMRWCAACHVVAEGQTSASVDVPPFVEIKKKYDGKMDFLEAFLSQSHPQMPDMNLTYLEIRNLIAYFEGLQTDNP